MSVLDRLSRYLSSPKRGDRAKTRSRQVRPRIESLEGRAVPTAIATPPIFQNPFMAPNNVSEIHLNSYQTDTSSIPGPGTFGRPIAQQAIIRPPVQIGGTIAFFLNAAGPLRDGAWLKLGRSATWGTLAGAAGGAAGLVLGELVIGWFQGGLIGRALSWAILGLGIGISQFRIWKERLQRAVTRELSASNHFNLRSAKRQKQNVLEIVIVVRLAHWPEIHHLRKAFLQFVGVPMHGCERRIAGLQARQCG